MWSEGTEERLEFVIPVREGSFKVGCYPWQWLLEQPAQSFLLASEYADRLQMWDQLSAGEELG